MPPAAAAGREPTATPLPEERRYRVERLLEADVIFLITGEGGRIAVLADEGGLVVPHRFENGSWQALPLPDSRKVPAAEASLGIYFGRDNRPRLMGHRGRTEPRMVYLRHRDGRWQEERSEIGALATDTSQLFGVLGEADPEVVCKVGGICLVKTRKGWKEVAATIPPSAVVRVFQGKGWALTPAGIFRADDGGFVPVGPPAPWKGQPTGFWVGDDGAMAVADAEADVIHRLDAGASAWTKERAPVAGPRDVAGPAGNRWVSGDGGLAHFEGARWSRVGDAGVRLRRWISTPGGGLVAGRSGVFAVRAVP